MPDSQQHFVDGCLEFFSIHMAENDSLSSLMTRIDAAMIKVKNLRSSSFTIDELDKELMAITRIRALHESYAHFASWLPLLDKLDKNTLQSAFVIERALRSRSSVPGSTSVLSAPTSLPPSTAPCEFCTIPGHAIASCHRFCAKRTAPLRRLQNVESSVSRARRTLLLRGRTLHKSLRLSSTLARPQFIPHRRLRPLARFSRSLDRRHRRHCSYDASPPLAAQLHPLSHSYPPCQQHHRLL